MKVALYIRLWCESQVDTALASQEQLLRLFADKNQKEVVGTFRDVGSGQCFERPGWNAMLSKLSASHYDGVLTKDMSRIGRNLEPTLNAIGEIEKTGAKIICINGDHQSIESTRQTMQELVRQFGKRQKSADYNHR